VKELREERRGEEVRLMEGYHQEKGRVGCAWGGEGREEGRERGRILGIRENNESKRVRESFLLEAKKSIDEIDSRV